MMNHMKIIKPQKKAQLKKPTKHVIFQQFMKIVIILESRKYFFRPFIEIEKSFIIT